jgi:hypothetical protein
MLDLASTAGSFFIWLIGCTTATGMFVYELWQRHALAAGRISAVKNHDTDE